MFHGSQHQAQGHLDVFHQRGHPGVFQFFPETRGERHDHPQFLWICRILRGYRVFSGEISHRVTAGGGVQKVSGDAAVKCRPEIFPAQLESFVVELLGLIGIYLYVRIQDLLKVIRAQRQVRISTQDHPCPVGGQRQRRFFCTKYLIDSRSQPCCSDLLLFFLLHRRGSSDVYAGQPQSVKGCMHLQFPQK